MLMQGVVYGDMLTYKLIKALARQSVVVDLEVSKPIKQYFLLERAKCSLLILILCVISIFFADSRNEYIVLGTVCGMMLHHIVKAIKEFID